MIAVADKKAALAFLDSISVAVRGNDPAAILQTCAAAIDFYRTLYPETADEFVAVEYGVDAIAFAQIRALDLLGSS